MIALACDISLQVIARYCLHIPPTWTEELARRLMQIIVFGGGGIAYRKSEMIGITLLVEHLPTFLKRACAFIVNLVILAFCLFLAYTGYKMCIQVGNQLSPALRLPKWPFYATIPFFGVMTAIFAVEKMAKMFVQGQEE